MNFGRILSAVGNGVKGAGRYAKNNPLETAGMAATYGGLSYLAHKGMNDAETIKKVEEIVSSNIPEDMKRQIGVKYLMDREGSSQEQAIKNIDYFIKLHAQSSKQ